MVISELRRQHAPPVQINTPEPTKIARLDGSTNTDEVIQNQSSQGIQVSSTDPEKEEMQQQLTQLRSERNQLQGEVSSLKSVVLNLQIKAEDSQNQVKVVSKLLKETQLEKQALLLSRDSLTSKRDSGISKDESEPMVPKDVPKSVIAIPKSEVVVPVVKEQPVIVAPLPATRPAVGKLASIAPLGNPLKALPHKSNETEVTDEKIEVVPPKHKKKVRKPGQKKE